MNIFLHRIKCVHLKQKRKSVKRISRSQHQQAYFLPCVALPDHLFHWWFSSLYFDHSACTKWAQSHSGKSLLHQNPCEFRTEKHHIIFNGNLLHRLYGTSFSDADFAIRGVEKISALADRTLSGANPCLDLWCNPPHKIKDPQQKSAENSIMLTQPNKNQLSMHGLSSEHVMGFCLFTSANLNRQSCSGEGECRA